MKLHIIDLESLNAENLRGVSVSTDGHVQRIKDIREALREAGVIVQGKLFAARTGDDEYTVFMKLQALHARADIVETLSNTSLEEVAGARLYLKAQAYATKVHGEQKYGANLPYTFHLRQTDKIVDHFLPEIPLGKTMMLKAASWLHDVLEDTAVSDQELKNEFGAELSDIVVKVTKRDEVDTTEFEDSYYTQVSRNPLAVFIKIFDKCANTKQTLKNRSMWHAMRVINGHDLFKKRTYGMIEGNKLKDYLDGLVARLSDMTRCEILRENPKIGLTP